MLNVAALLVSADGGRLGTRRDAHSVEQVGDRAIWNATVNREADLTGAAGRIARGAVGNSRGERTERVRIHVRPRETFVAGKPAATDVNRRRTLTPYRRAILTPSIRALSAIRAWSCGA